MQSFSLVQAGEEWQVQQLGRLVDMPSPAFASTFSGNGAVSFQASLASAIAQDSYLQKILAGKRLLDGMLQVHQIKLIRSTCAP